MKQMKKVTLQCPSCKKRVEKKKIQQVGSILPFEGMISERDNLLDSFIMVLSKYPEYYQWACDTCIKEGQALLANPKAQFYTFKHPWDTANPYLAYFDKSFRCKSCKLPFTFSKEEQKHWYEKLSFVVYSKPLNCPPCRKEIRDQKMLHIELSDLLREGDPRDKEALLRIAAIYEEMGKEEKRKKYLTAANKLR